MTTNIPGVTAIWATTKVNYISPRIGSHSGETRITIHGTGLYSDVNQYMLTMYTVHCTLYNVHCTMYTVQCTLYNVHCTMYTVQCTMYNVHCTLYSVQCTLYTVHCTLYIVHCTLYTVHCTLYTVQCTVTIYVIKCIYFIENICTYKQDTNVPA